PHLGAGEYAENTEGRSGRCRGCRRWGGVRRMTSAATADFVRRRRRLVSRGYPLSARNAKQGQVSPDGLPESDIGGQYLEVCSRLLGNAGYLLLRRCYAVPPWLISLSRKTLP